MKCTRQNTREKDIVWCCQKNNYALDYNEPCKVIHVDQIWHFLDVVRVNDPKQKKIGVPIGSFDKYPMKEMTIDD